MSSTVKSRGFIAVLKNPISEDAPHEEWSEKLYDDKSTLDITSDGKIVFSDIYRHEKYDVREDIYTLDVGNKVDDLDAFKAELAKYEFEIVEGTTQPYNCIWYNGSDCPVSMLTTEEYLDML